MQAEIRKITMFFVGLTLIANVEANPLKPQVAPAPTQLPLPAVSQVMALSPYKVELSVGSESKIEQEQAFIQALKWVLTQSSNNQNIANLPEVKTALFKPRLYIERYKYTTKNAGTNKPLLFLQIDFDSKAIDKLLQRSAKVVVLNTKPMTLVWLAKDIGSGKILSNDDVDDNLVPVLEKKSQELGMSLVLPSLDLEDIGRVKAKDICHFNLEAIKSASRRYGAALIVVGCLKPPVLDKTWSSQWQLVQGVKTNRFDFKGESAEITVIQALEVLAKNMTNVITQVSGPDSKVALRITNVNGLDQYHEVDQYLRNVSKIVTQVDLVNMNSTDVEFAVSIIGGQQALQNVLNNQNKLIPNIDVVASPPGVDLDYKWVGY